MAITNHYWSAVGDGEHQSLQGHLSWTAGMANSLSIKNCRTISAGIHKKALSVLLETVVITVITVIATQGHTTLNLLDYI